MHGVTVINNHTNMPISTRTTLNGLYTRLFLNTASEEITLCNNKCDYIVVANKLYMNDDDYHVNLSQSLLTEWE